MLQRSDYLAPGVAVLGFHTLGLYVHNDVVVVFGTPEKQNLIELEPVRQGAQQRCCTGLIPLLSNPDSIASTAGAACCLTG